MKSLRTKPVTRIIDFFNQNTPRGALPGIRACVDPLAKSNDYYGPDGWFAVKGNPVLENSSKQSHSQVLQDTLWKYSVDITKLDIKL